MRLWSLHPQYLDPQGLVALWRETLLAQAVLRGETRGYRSHPQLDRFKHHAAPLAAISRYLQGIHAEAVVRGYAFDTSKIKPTRSAVTLTVTTGQMEYEWTHLLAKLKERNPAIRIVGAQPSEGSRIPGIRKWPEAYMPKIYDPASVDELVLVSQADAEDMVRRLAREEGLFAGISAAGACWVAMQIAAQVEGATIVFVVCDRGDRYLSTGVFPA